MIDPGALDVVFKAYDIRGVVPDELDPELVGRVGAAFIEVLGDPTAIAVGYDMRESSPMLADAFAEGARSRGTDVIDIGTASTDELYFASGHLDIPGAMITASHNPPEYGGLKLCRAGAAPVGEDSGLSEIRRLVETGIPPSTRAPGRRESRDLLPAYAEFLRGLVDLSGIRRLNVAVDAGNGMAGLTVPAVFDGLNLDLIEMYFELDGTFPNHPANPIEPANLVDLQAEVVRSGADLGLAFDGDADRCWVIDETGASVPPSAICGLVADRELDRVPGSAIIHNVITSHAVPELVTRRGGIPVRTRVGHSFIKAKMAETGAVFGGEHSAHFYFRDFWRADSGLLAALHTIAALGTSDRPLSELVAQYNPYPASGEINNRVPDPAAAIDRVRREVSDTHGLELDELDGLTVEHAGPPMWWFNIRPSNTEPVLRLNVEAIDADTVRRVTDDVLGWLRKG